VPFEANGTALLLLRLGDGATPLSAALAPVFVEQYVYVSGSTWARVLTLALDPTKCMLTGSDLRAGKLNRSPSGREVVLGCINPVSPANSRRIVRISANGTVDYSTTFTATDPANSAWSVIMGSPDGLFYWAAGTNNLYGPIRHGLNTAAPGTLRSGSSVQYVDLFLDSAFHLMGSRGDAGGKCIQNFLLTMPQFSDVTGSGDDNLNAFTTYTLINGFKAFKAADPASKTPLFPTNLLGINTVFICDTGMGMLMQNCTSVTGAGAAENVWSQTPYRATVGSALKDCVAVELTAGSSIPSTLPWTTSALSGAFIAHRSGLYYFNRLSASYSGGQHISPLPLTEFRGVAWAPVPLLCEPGTYCPSGLPSSSTACPAGFLCPWASRAPLACPVGSFCPLRSWVATPCPAGTAGLLANLSSAACSGPCPAGYFCPQGSTSWYDFPCGRGSFCPQGSVGPTLCPSSDAVLGPANGPAMLVDTAACRNHCFSGAPGQWSGC
jgi:hypothetical protein